MLWNIEICFFFSILYKKSSGNFSIGKGKRSISYGSASARKWAGVAEAYVWIRTSGH